MITSDTLSKLGTELTAADRASVLNSYVHRFTREHHPAWARRPMPHGKAYPVQFASDAEWLAHTRFAVTTSGRLDARHRSCESTPTWPDNPELRKEVAA